MPTAIPVPGKTLLDPVNHTLIMIDHQSQMAFATKSIDAVSLRNNAGLVAKAAADFKVSTILTTWPKKPLADRFLRRSRMRFLLSRWLTVPR
jgi:nicotinamidase-related amidase